MITYLKLSRNNS